MVDSGGRFLSGDTNADDGAVLPANERLDHGGHAVFLGHGNSVAVDGAHFPALGTDVIFCLIRTRTTVMYRLIDTEKFNGAILISLYRREPDAITDVESCEALKEGTQMPEEVSSGLS